MPRYQPATPPRGKGNRLWGDPSLPALAAFGVAAILIAAAQFASFTYIRPYLETSASIDAQWAAGLLFVYGAAGMVGVIIAGFLADRFPRSSFAMTLMLFAVAFATLAIAPGTLWAVVAGLVVWGFALGAIFPLLQTTLMRVATDNTRTLAGAGIVVFFNVGIAVGPWFGGLLGGETAPTVNMAASAVAMLVAAALGVVGFLLARRDLPRGHLADPDAATD
ncbi:MFS transporter [Microbacterium sp. zg-YB36]|uniref:MFS transporter n=1 Tax=Microbacterium sp. zg-YB36 TaxID=2969407 RepID=UPI00214B3811|nr:MFS transporter [Microbacterium sp. zg-YB36]MDL5352728.1 MFS transporter [Microbacterium sp. zg-YB36]